MPTPEDCTLCGACCFSESPRHARVTGDDYARLGDVAEQLVGFLGNQAFMRIAPVRAGASMQCCTALVLDTARGTFHCSVYAERPSVCRELARGLPACLGELATKRERPRRALTIV